MRTLASPFRVPAALAVLVPLLALIWLVAVPDVLTPLSYAAAVGLLAALGTIALHTYKNAQPTGTVAQLLHDADSAGSSSTGTIKRPASQHRPSA